MTTIIAIFSLSLVLALILTPLVGRVARKCDLVDVPSERKVHTQPIPRAGGAAIFLAFCLSLLAALFYRTKVVDLLVREPRIIPLVLGACVAFGLGLWDDIRRLSPGVKFAFQALAAVIAYVGGMRIVVVGLPGLPVWHLGLLSLPVTVFWVLLMMNAINLIDGLDGLAAGVSFFACMVLVFLSVLREDFVTALTLAALGGASLGFLRYNFNPASVFMGDSGSYFIGYMLAGLSMLGSIKSQAAVAMLIPIIALGVPVMDTMLAPVRRFILGQRIFSPDEGHLHHRLLKLGLTHRNTVLLLYGLTVGMGIVSIIVIHSRDDQAAMILLLLGLGIILGMRKIGYLEYFATDKVYGWFKDVTDEAGFTLERRSFLNLQLEIGQSTDVKELWLRVCKALDRLKFDVAEMHLENLPELKEEKKQGKWVWMQGGLDSDISDEYLFKLELPLLANGEKSYGTLSLIKDLKRDPINHYTLRRVEHLRRTIMGTLQRLMKGEGE